MLKEIWPYIGRCPAPTYTRPLPIENPGYAHARAYGSQTIMVCKLYGMQTVWYADSMVCRLYGLQTVWSADSITQKIFKILTYWSSIL